MLTKAQYAYNALGEMTKAIDPEGSELNVEYDWMGRRIALESRDIGRKEYDYDSRGNLSRESDSVLRGKGTFIRYGYDGLNRLVLIDYPDSVDTVYEYGAPGAPNGQANRIAKVTDETGSTRYGYGKLGETTEETRTIKHIISGQGTERTKATGYTSNYLGQLEAIRFDDNETVQYEYNAGGQIRRVTGYKEIQLGDPEDGTFRYVKDIGYDEFGQRVFIEYGNGVQTTYTYDPYRRWLTNIVTNDAQEVKLQNIDYGINKVGNVEYYVNNADRYYTKQEYSYDNLYQLTGVTGTTKNYLTASKQVLTLESSYTQSFGFDSLGNGKMVSKTSTEKTMGTRNGDNLNYNLQYRYYEGTHKAEQIGDMYYKYDSNGNLLSERFGGHAATSAVNAQVYEENGVYSTDYGFALVHPNSTETSSGVYQRDYRWNERNLLSRSVDSRYRVEYRYGADGQRALKYSFHAALEGETLYFNRFFQTDYSSSRDGWQESKHIFVGETRIATKRREERTGTNYGQEKKETYFYHGDHLGSAQLVTGTTGEIYEQLEYTPYGELWVEHLSGTETTPFRFTAKERDSQTGLYYFGARYLDPHTSLWLSADPAMGEYIPQAPINDEAKKHNQNLPGMGGVFNYVNFHVYHYAGNNPVKLVDPNGEDIHDIVTGFTQAFSKLKPLFTGKGSPEDLENMGDFITEIITEIIPEIIQYLGPVGTIGLIFTGVVLGLIVYGLREPIAKLVNFIKNKMQMRMRVNDDTDIEISGGRDGIKIGVVPGENQIPPISPGVEKPTPLPPPEDPKIGPISPPPNERPKIKEFSSEVM